MPAATEDRPRSLARAARRLAAACAVALACGCGSRPSPDDSLQSIRSWTATGRLAGELWLAGSAPSGYAGATLRTAGEQVRQALATLRSGPLPAAVAADTAELGASLGRLRALGRAVERGDRAAVRARLPALAADERRAGALRDRVSKGGG